MIARGLRIAPNRVPELMKPAAPVVLRWPKGMVERFPTGTNLVGTPPVPIHWRIIEPADYGLQISNSVRSSGSRTIHEFGFRLGLPSQGLPPAGRAIGTVFLLHGYGVDGDALFPWALYLAEAGWRSVLVDLRGHGTSGGRWVTFGTTETNDLRCLRQTLEKQGLVRPPYAAMGHSMGASMALRWPVTDPEIRASVALGAYAEFADAVVRLRDGYAPWVPKAWARRAALRLPELLDVPPHALDTAAAIRGKGVRAFFVASAGDTVTPPEASSELRELAGPGSGFLVVGDATHEMLPYLFEQHGPPVVKWLAEVAREARVERIAASPDALFAR